jgi:prophage antirepressor-like protein
MPNEIPLKSTSFCWLKSEVLREIHAKGVKITHHKRDCHSLHEDLHFVTGQARLKRRRKKAK